MSTALPLDALLFALGAALFFACLDLSQKWSSKYAIESPRAFLGLRFGAGAIVSPLLLLLPGALTHRHFELWPFAGLVAANLCGNILYLRSVYQSDISALGSLWPLKNAYLPFLAILLPPHVQFPISAYAWVAIATVGSVLIAWNDNIGWNAIRDRSILRMIFLTVPVFALSDYFLNQVVGSLGSALGTVLAAFCLAGIGLPLVLFRKEDRAAVVSSLSNRNGLIGALLTGVFLVAGVACIGEAFKRSTFGGYIFVNVYAMLSGVVLLLVTSNRQGWLERQSRRVYGIRFGGAALVIIAAAELLRIKFAIPS